MEKTILETLKLVEKVKKEWEQTMDCIGDIIMVVDHEGCIVRINKALVNLTGLSFQDFLERRWEEVLVNCGFIEHIIDTKSGHIEYSYMHKKWFTLSKYPIERLIKTGLPGIVVMLKDITEKKLADEKLQSEKQRFQTLSEHAPFGIAMIDDYGRYTYINPTFIEIFGYDLNDFSTGKEWFALVFPDKSLRHEAISLWLEHIEDKKMKKTSSCIFDIVCKDGTQKKVNIAVVTLNRRLACGEGYLLFCEDVTRQKMMEEVVDAKNRDLKQKNEELEKAYNQLKSAQSQILQQEKMASIGQLAAGIAHEINNPIGFIMSNLNSLSRYVERLSNFIEICEEMITKLDENKGEKAHIIEKLSELKHKLKIDFILNDIMHIIDESKDGTDRVKRIVQDLKSFSHVDETEQKPSNINQGLESTINIVWNELKYKARVIKEYGNIPLTKCNLGQLNQVFMNILINAAQAIVNMGEIKVKTWQDNSYIVISISDNGCGIPEEIIHRIYEPFYTTKRVGEGTGLGLSIAYDIVRKHNGEIKVRSEVGKGTEFTIRIPIVEA